MHFEVKREKEEELQLNRDLEIQASMNVRWSKLKSTDDEQVRGTFASCVPSSNLQKRKMKINDNS